MRIACPTCGLRGLEEFTYVADADVRRPYPSASDAMAEFVRYVYERENAPGLQRGLWQHALGCRGWLVIERNATTHEIVSVALARDVARQRLRSESIGNA